MREKRNENIKRNVLRMKHVPINCSFLFKKLLLSISFILYVLLITQTSTALRTKNCAIDNEDKKIMFVENFFKVRRRLKREHAFELLKLESQLGNENETQKQAQAIEQQINNLESLRRDDALDDENCQKLCNDKLRKGLDMVKAHSSFGSVGVPSVIDQYDLEIFCRLDSTHDKCLNECGFEIHFNMRDYVCKDRFAEMVDNLKCYEKSATQLKRKCGAKRCGPYSELEVTLPGFAQRCRTLLCDLNCTQSVLVSQCGFNNGHRATKFLVDYSRKQISTWMRDMAKSLEEPISKIISPSCVRLFCDNFDSTNCTSIIELSTLPSVINPLPIKLSRQQN